MVIFIAACRARGELGKGKRGKGRRRQPQQSQRRQRWQGCGAGSRMSLLKSRDSKPQTLSPKPLNPYTPKL